MVRLTRALSHLSALTLETAGPLLLPLPPHLGGGLFNQYDKSNRMIGVRGEGIRRGKMVTSSQCQ